MIPIEEVLAARPQHCVNCEPTLDKTPSRPFDLCRNDHPSGYITRPHDTRPRLDRKHVPARNIRRSCRGQGRNVIIEVAMYDLVGELALRLSRSYRGVEGFDVGHISGE